MRLFEQFRAFLQGKPPVIPQAQESSDRRARPRVNPKEKTRILVIDDSPTILAAMRRFLESAHCTFLDAADAKAGLEIALTQKPALIFLDIVMPGINGFAALRALRKNARTRDIPVIMMSGNEQAAAHFFGSGIDADDFMKKPFSRFEIFNRIERLLDPDHVPRRPLLAANQAVTAEDMTPPEPTSASATFHAEPLVEQTPVEQTIATSSHIAPIVIPASTPLAEPAPEPAPESPRQPTQAELLTQLAALAQQAQSDPSVLPALAALSAQLSVQLHQAGPAH
ncbi:MAG: response regulator [Azoarcus sp.]|jgi:twitching motility two-component system response regulator PilH|nr:response regulator [Azoarcus sp.]